MTQPSDVPVPPVAPHGDEAQPHGPHGSFWVLTLGALGVVYGDIGTSPLYAVNEIFLGHGGVTPTPQNVIGCISLVVWTLTLVICCKYLVFVLRADNDGEGGTFALFGLLHGDRRAGVAALLPILMLAAGLLFGEGVITPAISVLSAVEGLAVATPVFANAIVPITIVILTVLFAFQFLGTAKVGAVFGPVVVCWFAAIGLLGTRQILKHPEILAALNPGNAVGFLGRTSLHGCLLVLGAVVLAITGGEALFADMGHFGKRPIRTGWFGLVYPALLLSYLGQGAYLVGGTPVLRGNLFFSLVPRTLLYPMVALATAATVIASQALISGAFSLTSQAVALGLFPRLKIVNTHQQHFGQIYVPLVNWALYVGCVALVLGFRSSSALAAAYGLAVSGVMLATSLAMILISQRFWKWSPTMAVLCFGPLAVIDASFLTANSLKFLEGGYIPLALGVTMFGIMTTWRWGRATISAAYSSKKTMTVGELIELKQRSQVFIERNALLMVPASLRAESDNTPALLQLLLERMGVLPKHLIFVEVVHARVPYVHEGRYQVRVFQRDAEKGTVMSVSMKFGFMEEPDVEHVLEDLASHHEIDLPTDTHEWIVHVSQERVVAGKTLSALWRLRLRLFALMRRLAQPSYYAYGLGREEQLSIEIMPVRMN